MIPNFFEDRFHEMLLNLGFKDEVSIRMFLFSKDPEDMWWHFVIRTSDQREYNSFVIWKGNALEGMKENDKLSTFLFDNLDAVIEGLIHITKPYPEPKD